MDKLTVSLDDYIRYLVKKWKTIIAVVLIFVLLFALSAKILGEKIVIPPSEEYLALKEEAASIGGYIENAPLMKIDSTCVQEIVIYISNISEREELKNYIDAGVVWSDYEKDNAPYYFLDIVTWTDGSDEQSAEIKIQHYEEAECGSMVKYLIKSLQSYDENIEVYTGTLHVSNDESIAEVQIWYKNRMNAIEGQLEHVTSGYTIETSMSIAVIVGALVGALSAMMLLFVGFLLKKEC